MNKPAKPKTKDSQLKATRAYQERNARFALWYPTEVKKGLEKAIEAHGLTVKGVFELGLKHAKIPLPKPE